MRTPTFQHPRTHPGSRHSELPPCARRDADTLADRLYVVQENPTLVHAFRFDARPSSRISSTVRDDN